DGSTRRDDAGVWSGIGRPVFGCSGCCCASGVSRAGALSPCSPSSSVLRKRAASGPSRMLARLELPPLAIPENLLGESPVRICGLAVRVVLEHRHPLNGRLRKAHRLGDPRSEDAIPEV